MRKVGSLFLCGFRCTGKTTIGPLVAQKLGWEFIEMDDEIAKASGKTIDELTVNGTDWQKFRQTEYDLLQKLITKKNVVISTGGGVGVNNIIKTGTHISFGRLEMNLFTTAPSAFVVVLNSSMRVIRTRIVRQEMSKQNTQRPLLGESRAKEVSSLLKRYENDAYKQKIILTDAIVQDSLRIYRNRIPLYDFLSPHHVDTGVLSIEQTIGHIIHLVT